MQVVPTLETTNPAIRTWRRWVETDGGPNSIPTSVIYLDLPVRASPCHFARSFPEPPGLHHDSCYSTLHFSPDVFAKDTRQQHKVTPHILSECA